MNRSAADNYGRYTAYLRCTVTATDRHCINRSAADGYGRLTACTCIRASAADTTRHRRNRTSGNRYRTYSAGTVTATTVRTTAADISAAFRGSNDRSAADLHGRRTAFTRSERTARTDCRACTILIISFFCCRIDNAAINIDLCRLSCAFFTAAARTDCRTVRRISSNITTVNIHGCSCSCIGCRSATTAADSCSSFHIALTIGVFTRQLRSSNNRSPVNIDRYVSCMVSAANVGRTTVTRNGIDITACNAKIICFISNRILLQTGAHTDTGRTTKIYFH